MKISPYGIQEQNEQEKKALPLGSLLLINGTQSEALEAPFYVYFATQKNSFLTVYT